MSIVDLLIGLTLMNAMPHFVLGIWKGRMFSAFGFGDLQNIFYGLLNFVISISLFVYKYGLEGLVGNGLYAGALLLLVIYFLTGRFWYVVFHKRYYEQRR